MWRNVISRMQSALKIGAAMWVLLVVCVFAGQARAADDGNRLKSIDVTSKADGVEVLIKADKPIGYRYTVYDSQDPRRIVVDFRGMDVSGIQTPISSSSSPVSEVRVSSFDLTSGKLGRVEVLLDGEGDYNVTLDERNLTLALAPVTTASQTAQTLPEPAAVVETPVETTAPPVVEPVVAETAAEPAAVVEPTPVAPEPARVQPSAPAKKVQAVRVEAERVLLQSDGDVQMFKYFTLTGPTRLVVDVYKVKKGFKDNSFVLSSGFKKLRTGEYPDKIRFVFDSASTKLPDFGVNKEGDAVVVAWGGSKGDLSTPLPEPTSGPVAVEALDFFQQDATSVFAVSLSGNFREIKPVAEGNIVRFGVQNATIGRELRRVFDSSAFPSSVRMVTPYTVQRSYGQDVMFAVDMKGPVEYKLDPAGKSLKFVAENDAFNEMAPVSIELREVEAVLAETQAAADAASRPGGVEGTKTLDLQAGQGEPLVPQADIAAMTAEPLYSGQKITLVFDNADIRDILQLIADVSNMNIIAGDDVQGNLSIRLVDVPWDQALDIVLDIKGLGKMESNNVVRIMPKELIRENESAELDALDLRRQKAPLETRVIPVSYTDITTISGQVAPLLTKDRGTITEDSRNKQLIVTDIADVLDEVENLVRVLDTPERQVMIEARIVEANTNFSRDLGVNWGVSWDNSANANSGDLNQAQVGGGGSFLIAPPAIGGVGGAGLGSNFLFGNTALDSTIIDLRLSALETTGTGKVISTPRVTTLNGKNATIKQGTKIPYVAVGDDGAETKFESAELKLDVTPEINPDRSIILDINASNSTVGATVPTGVGNAIAIDNKEANTSVLVKDGETVVIGGIFVEDDRESETGVPLLKDIPILGHLFKSTTITNERRELLIFITPRILN